MAANKYFVLPWPHHKTRFAFALVLALRLQRGAFCMIATVCSSWVFLSRSTCLGWILQPFYAVIVGLGVGRSNCEQTYTKNYLIEHVCCILRSNYEQTYKNLSSWTCVLYIDSSIGPQPRTGRSVWNPSGDRTVRMVEDANATFYNLGRELVGMGIRMSCITCFDFLYLLCLDSFLLNTRFR